VESKKDKSEGLKPNPISISDILRFGNTALKACCKPLAEKREASYEFIFQEVPSRAKSCSKMTQKTTNEIRKLIRSAKLDFKAIENEALNAYLPRLFHSCPISEDVCTRKQCMECEVFKRSTKTALAKSAE
jgi:hypothetical protein